MASLGGSLISSTLHEITTIKLTELSARQSAFSTSASSLLASLPPNPSRLDRLWALSKGVKQCFALSTEGPEAKVVRGATPHRRLEAELRNLDRFLAQAGADPSISEEMMGKWEACLMGHVETMRRRYEFAALYGDLVREWLAEEAESRAEHGGEFQDVGEAKRVEARMEWEKRVFEPAGVDTSALKAYLEGLFGGRSAAEEDSDNEKVWEALQVIREGVKAFEAQLARPGQFTVDSLGTTINSLLGSDVLSDEKREALRDFQGSKAILSEVADVLNMRLAALDTWTWAAVGGGENGAVTVDQRRGISGKYGVRMREDLLQAIFLEFVGTKWSVFLKAQFKHFCKNKHAWKSLREDVPQQARRKLEHYLGTDGLSRRRCLNSKRMTLHRKRYFVARLLDNEQQSTPVVDGEEEADYTPWGADAARKPAPSRFLFDEEMEEDRKRSREDRYAGTGLGRGGAMRHRRILTEDSDDDLDNDHDADRQPKSPMRLKQEMLHILAAEATLAAGLHDGLTAFHSVFDDWDALLPHETTQTVLEFFGVSRRWLGFFERFLAVPLKFADDGGDGRIRQRRRGTPSSHVLSDVLSETVLFCLDVAVNHATGGKLLWRVQDALWFWATDHREAAAAWTAVEGFLAASGTQVDRRKTGTVRVPGKAAAAAGPDVALDPALPRGPIRWGFLVLSATTGRFEIDEAMVDAHIAELRRQLFDARAQKSIFSLVRVWNGYAATFFTANFGRAANCFGREHVDAMLRAHERIQRGVFATAPASPPGDGDDDVRMGSASGGSLDAGRKTTSVVEYIKTLLAARFGATSVPDGFLYFPAERGGLGLRSPFVSLLLIRDVVLATPDSAVTEMQKEEREGYETARLNFWQGDVDNDKVGYAKPEDEAFLTFAEFVRYRDDFRFCHQAPSRDSFEQLLNEPHEESVEADDGAVAAAVAALPKVEGNPGVHSSWSGMQPYWRWVVMMYGPEIVERFGGLGIVDPGLLPMGMLGLVRERRVVWQG